MAKRANGGGGRGRRAAAATGADEGLPPTSDYRHAGARRKNLPGAAITGEGEVPKAKRVRYAYSPHLDPVLRFDPTGRADRVAAVVDKACRGERLDAAEQEILRAVGRNWEQPWLEWAGKQEEHARGHFAVDPVALHIHERISAQAILRQAMREDTERSLFAAPEQSYAEALQFYRHDVDWANRLILGDSLQVMSSLAHRENLAGKVQMIYIDPPYGIKFGSNFQPDTATQQVKDRPEDMTRDPETVRAYRDTWHLGVHSYLDYLTSRIKLARDLLADSGSIFVQIGGENLDAVAGALADIFGRSNAVSCISFRTKVMPLNLGRLDGVCAYLIWFAKNREALRYRQLFRRRTNVASLFQLAESDSGEIAVAKSSADAKDEQRLLSMDLVSSGSTATCMFPINIAGRTISPRAGQSWKTNLEGVGRLGGADRLMASAGAVRYKLRFEDYPVSVLTNLWEDTSGADDKRYVVQTNTEVVKRCMLMTTDPGDLVIDPTCGSGTTACVAEEWGRRWITIDTSRVALSIARQRLLTAKFDHYRTKGGPNGNLGAETPATGFIYKTVPHITLGAIAQNTNLDPIFAKHEPILAERLEAANRALKAVPAAPREALKAKLDEKARTEGRRAITDADRRRWILPPGNRDPKEKWTVDAAFAGWYDWEVPFDTDPDWPKPLQEAVTAYRAAWRAKMDEVNRCIAANADQEQLVDQPEKVPGVVRVSGPFTVEGVIPEELALTETGAVTDLTPNEFEADDAAAADRSRQQNAVAYLRRMIDAIKADGVQFPGNKRMRFSHVESLVEQGTVEGVHAEATEEGKDEATVGIVFGPEYGPVTAQQIEDAIRGGGKFYADLVIAGFAFAPEATALLAQLEGMRNLKARVHLAHMRPDLNTSMATLLKEPDRGSNQQLFSVFGLPAISVRPAGRDEFTVTLDGVDIFDPVQGTVISTKGEKVSAWFLDSDYDGRCFCACQAFFPNQDAWEKIARALGGDAEPEAFAAFKGRTSLPFARGKHGRIAVKAIDARGSEVMAVKSLEKGA